MTLREALTRFRTDLERRLYFRAVYRRTFETEDGCIVLQDLYARFGGTRSTCVFGSPDHSAYNEGQRSVWLHLQAKMRWSDVQVRDVMETGLVDPLELQ